MMFVSYKEFVDGALELSNRIPNKFDLIVGIPRAGLVLASILATKFGRPLTVPDNDMWKSPNVKTILICDDAISSGYQMVEAYKMVQSKYPNADIETAVVIKHEQAQVNYFHSLTCDPKLFEWNIAHVKQGRLACDIDGVLCPDAPIAFDETSNPDGYGDYIRNALPMFIPQYTIDAIVSNRMEIWREETERWLRNVGVKYDKLYLWDIEKPLDRIFWTEEKIRQIKEANVDYVIESSWEQSLGISDVLGIPVLCYDRMEMV